MDIKDYLNSLSNITSLTKLIAGSFGIACNANDTFMTACADMVLIDPEDLHWVLPIFEKYEWSGLFACMAHIVGKDVLSSYQDEKYKKALEEIRVLNPLVVSEY